MITFRYKEEPTGDKAKKIKRPVADIYLLGPSGRWIEFHPYIDSGADVTLIPLSLGELVGLKVDERKIEQIGGIRGTVPVIYHQVKMKLGAVTLSTQIGWALIEEVPPLLGRVDVFDTFNVTFRQREGVIIFDDKIDIITATPKEKKKLLHKSTGAWKGTRLDDDNLWKEV